MAETTARYGRPGRRRDLGNRQKSSESSVRLTVRKHETICETTIRPPRMAEFEASPPGKSHQMAGSRICSLSRTNGPKGRADLVPETRPISRRRQKVDGAPLRGTREEQTGRGWVGRKSCCATLDHYLMEIFHRPPVWRFALLEPTHWHSVASRAGGGNGAGARVS